MRSTSRCGGFSLIEVLCALFILGVGLVGLMEGITLALRSTKETERMTRAVLLAASQIEELRAESYVIEADEEGECGELLPGCGWRKRIARTEIDGLYHVSFSVTEAKGEKTLYELKSLLFDMPFETGVESDAQEDRAKSSGRRDRERDARRKGGAR